MVHSDLAGEKLLAAYSAGVFPMADEEGKIQWLAPDPRAVIDLGGFKIPRSVQALRRRGAFKVTVNTVFDAVIDECADRPEGTWISDDMKEAYRSLHRWGFAHSMEAWKGEQLAGGLYGVSIRGAFFGESMFHRVSGASKIALVHLVERVKERGLVLLDVQFTTEHLRHYGAVEIPRAEYERRLTHALSLSCSFADPPDG